MNSDNDRVYREAIERGYSETNPFNKDRQVICPVCFATVEFRCTVAHDIWHFSEGSKR